MSYGLCSIDYRIENNKPVIYLFTRDEGKNRKIFKVKHYKPYYYYKDLFGEHPVRGLDGAFVTKKYTKLPSDVAVQRERHHVTYESDILFPIRFMVDRGIRYGLDIKDGEVVPANFTGSAVLPLFLDIEVEVKDVNVFPDPRKAEAMLLAVTIWCPIDGNAAMWQFEIHNEEEEAEFLEYFITLIEEFDPDVLTSYNVFFDMATILGRMKFHDIDINRLSPLGYASISRKYDDVRIAGRNVFDYYRAYKKYKHKTLPSYKLEDISFDECDIPHSNYPMERMNRQHPSDITDYNLLDVYRMQALEFKLEIIPFYDNLRRTVGCTFKEVFEASKYVDIMLLRYAKGKFVLPRRMSGRQKLDYVGAVVLPPKKGLHKNIAMLDFTKHYPIILISYNISPETLRLTEPTEPHYTLSIGVKHKDDMGDEYVTWQDVYYLKEPAGLLPSVARDLITLRNDVRDKMLKLSRDSAEYKLLWFRQDALKVVLDAMYGVFAYPNFRLFIPQLSASMTGQGRKLILRTIDFVEKKGYKALYGDSVTGDCPIITKQTNKIDIIPIEDLQPNVAVWTRTGWHIPKRILRKPCNKKMYEVITPAGIIKCTEDHSLLNAAGDKIKPTEIDSDSQLLLTKYPKGEHTTCVVNEQEAWIIGLFMADGSNMGGKASSYVILTKHQEEAAQISGVLTKLGIRNNISDYRKSSGVFSVKIYTCYLWKLLKQTYSIHRHRKVPQFILNASPNIQIAFLRGYFQGDGERNLEMKGYRYEFISLTSKSLPLLAGISFMLYNLTGQTHNISSHRTAYHMWLRSPKQCKLRCIPDGQVKLVRQISKPKYVYDLETDDASFCIGRIAVHNTDSVYFTVGDSPIKKGKKLRDDVNGFWMQEKDKYGLYDAPNVKLEYVFESLLLARKKRYSAMVIYDNGDKARSLKIVGFASRRSDSAVISQQLQNALFKQIHEEYRPTSAIIQTVKDFAAKVPTSPLKDICIPLPLKTPISQMKNRARVKSIIYANKYLDQHIDTGTHSLEIYIKLNRLKGEAKKEYGFKDKPILPWHLPSKFSFATWSPKEQVYVRKEYIADRIAFGKVPGEEWRQYMNMPAIVERTIWNKVDIILNALGVSIDDRIALYGSKRPIKKDNI